MVMKRCYGCHRYLGHYTPPPDGYVGPQYFSASSARMRGARDHLATYYLPGSPLIIDRWVYNIYCI